MASSSSRCALRARWILPIVGPPIEGGTVILQGEQIVAVERRGNVAGAIELGDVAILPGLVNAHTHLEFSDLGQPLGTAGMPLPTWIRQVVAKRRASATDTPAAIARGLAESLAAGVTAIGEIATSDWRTWPQTTLPANPQVRMFFELIAALPQRVAAATELADAFLAGPERGSVAVGLSPHAPYTVHPLLLEGIIERAKLQRIPLAMHLAESPEELELLRSGTGPFADLLRDFGVWDAGVDARLPSIKGYLERLATAPRALVVHGNYLEPDELDLLAAHAATMSVAYCPRTHHYFAHQPYPLAQMLERGIAMALGTDSRASTPDLELLAEMRFAWEQHPDVSARQIVELGTLGGAQALGLADRLGSLSPGKRADLAIVELSATCAADPYAAVLASESRVVQTWLAGAPVDSAGRSAGHSTATGGNS